MIKDYQTKILFVLLIFIWLSFFVNGAFNNSKEIFLKFEDSNGIIQSLKLVFLLLCTWTWSNLLILSCLASLMGEFGRIAMTNSRKYNLIAALIRGFFIYLFIVAGQLIVAGNIQLPQDYNPTGDEIMQAYVRLAMVCSLFGFAVGFKPTFFEGFLDKFIGRSTDKNPIT